MTDKKNILIVEDSPTQAIMLQSLLEQEGFVVDWASTAEDALDRLAVSLPDMVIADYHLPGIQGDEMCRRIRFNMKTQHLPVIMLTMDSSLAGELQGLDSGADDYVSKSEESDMLLLRVFAQLNKVRESDFMPVLARSNPTRARILVIDDSELYSSFLADELENEGFTVTIAHSGDEGLALARTDTFDCIIIDIVMPGMTGIEVCRHLNQRRIDDEIDPVLIAVSGDETRENVIRAMQAGADEFLMKSSEIVLIRARIRGLIRRQFLRQQNRQLFEEFRSKEMETLEARAQQEQAEARARLAEELQTANTRLEEAQRELVEARDRAEAANRSKSAFLANMSHELRTPLNAILGYSEMLQEEAEIAGLDEYTSDLKKINAAGRHLLGLINDILDLSKIEAGRMVLSCEDFRIADLIEDVSTTAAPLMEKQSNEFVLKIDEDMGAAYGDEMKVRQVIINLLSNAAKFTKQGTVTLAASRFKKDGLDWLSFSVSDTGIGMTPDQMKLVFEEFTQADSGVQKKFGGTGLGLALCRKFAEMMNGSIALESEFGKGSTFTFSVPAVVSEQSDPILSVLPAKEEAEVLETPRAPSGGEATVLIIDDDPSARETAFRYLSRLGWSVSTANDGMAGLEMIRRLRPSAVVLDILMPGMNGWEVLAAIKSDPAIADIPVLICSIIEERDRAFMLGAKEFLSKPVDRKQLARILDKFRPERGTALIVDDNENDCEMMARIVRKEGWLATTARDGRQGLESLAQEVPDLILLDLMMPEINGFEFVEELNQSPTWRNIPVVVVTSKDLGPEDYARLDGKIRAVIAKHGVDQKDMLSGLASMLVDVVPRPGSGPHEGARS